MTVDALDAADNINDFLARKIKNLRQLLSHEDFKGQFILKYAVKVDKFDLERDQLNQLMFLPTTQILYDSEHTFTELVFSFNTVRMREFHGELVRKTMIPNMITDYLLLQKKEAKDHLEATETGGLYPMVSCERFVVTHTDVNVLVYLIGYFYERDQEMMQNQFPILAFTKNLPFAGLKLKAENKALPIRGHMLKSFELSQCEIDKQVLVCLKSLLNSCQNITNLTLSHISSRLDWSELSYQFLTTVQQSLPFLHSLRVMNLSRSRLGDPLVSKLAEVLLAAPLLTDLDLTCIGMSGYGLR